MHHRKKGQPGCLRELVRKVRTASLGRVKVRLDGHRNAAADDAVAVTPAELHDKHETQG